MAIIEDIRWPHARTSGWPLTPELQAATVRLQLRGDPRSLRVFADAVLAEFHRIGSNPGGAVMDTLSLVGRARTRGLTTLGRTCCLSIGLMTAVASCSSDDSSRGASKPEGAVAGFVENLQKGDGKAACDFLTDDEQALFVTNAAEFASLDDSSCTTVVESFHADKGDRLSVLAGSFEDFASASGEVGSGNWVYADGGGQQRAAVVKVDGRWLIQTDENDFPSAVLHSFD